MSSSCIEEVSVPDDNWYRIANELLSRAGIAINGSAPADIRVKNPDFFKRVLQEGSLGSVSYTHLTGLLPANTEPVLPTWNHQWLPDSKTLCRSVRSVRRYAQRNG